MTIEATLESIDTTMKAILAAMQSGNQMAAATVETTKGTRKSSKKDAPEEAKGEPVVDGDPAGTQYWDSECNAIVFAQMAGDAPPQNDTFVKVTAAEYLAKKAAYEFAEKNAAVASAATMNQTTATTAPSAPAAQATASENTSGAEPTWDETVNKLKALATNPAHGQAAVKAIISQIDPTAANVPALQKLGRNADIIAAVDALLNPATGDAGMWG